jgi:hypothetical protein
MSGRTPSLLEGSENEAPKYQKAKTMKSHYKKILGGAALLLILLAAGSQKVRALAGAPVQVVNLISQWIPMASVDEPGRVPWMSKANINSGANSGNVMFYTVPKNSRLVITFVSGTCQSARGLATAKVQTTLNGNSYASVLPGLTKVLVPGYGNTYQNVLSQPVMAYADPGTDVAFWVEGNDLINYGIGSMYCDATFAGYLVNLTQPIVVQ